MKFVLSIILTLISITLMAQRVTLNELIKINILELVEAEDLLFQKGFISNPSGGEMFENFGFRKNNPSSLEFMEINKKVYKGKNIQTSFYSLKLEDYQKIKSELKPNNFQFISTEKFGANLTVHTLKIK
ncbi:hypothetical protein [Sphingobacterium sp.]|uniref:hypothetical protein n=1 Tax=Sphingobacterium sp. TaxID=341027 RepID=UPI0028B0DB37|nr:hypothetical protein [Sphingobacterium sp.]